MGDVKLPSGFDFSGYSFKGWDLSGIDLSGFDLDFSSVDLSWANLSNVKFGNFTWGSGSDFSHSRWSGLSFDLPNLSLSGSFKGVNFSGFDFAGMGASQWGFTLGSLPSFSGIELGGALHVENFLAGLYGKLKGLDVNLLAKLDFSFVDFGSLDFSTGIDWAALGLPDVDLAKLFQMGSYKGSSFAGFKLPTLGTPNLNFDFGKLNLSGADLRFELPTVNFPSFSFDGANLRGADLSGLWDAIASAGRAFFDALSTFSLPSGSGGTSISLADLQLKGLNEVALDNVFNTPVTGPAFAIVPWLDFSDSEAILGFNL